MPYFYSALIVYPTAFIFSILLTIIYLLISNKVIKITAYKLFILYIIIFFICVIICNFVIFSLQINIASPYIKEAINRQCGVNEVSIIDGEFHNDSRFRWTDAKNEIECRFSNSEWECRC